MVGQTVHALPARLKRRRSSQAVEHALVAMCAALLVSTPPCAALALSNGAAEATAQLEGEVAVHVTADIPPEPTELSGISEAVSEEPDSSEESPLAQPNDDHDGSDEARTDDEARAYALPPEYYSAEPIADPHDEQQIEAADEDSAGQLPLHQHAVAALALMGEQPEVSALAAPIEEIAAAEPQPPASTQGMPSTPRAASPAPAELVNTLSTLPLKRPEWEEVWLAVNINGQPLPQPALLLRGSDGRVLARAEDLKRWGLRLPDVESMNHDGEHYFALSAFHGLTFAINESTQSLVMQAPPGLFWGTVLKGSALLSIPQLPPVGAFLNYDVVGTHVQSESSISGLMEAGVFGRWGAGVSSFLARDKTIDSRLVRLETTLTHDRPGELDSFRLGDAISAGGSWGRPVRFGGVQWATNFATQPGFVTFPLPGLSGEAALPSTLDVYVNDALRLRREVPAGPFSISDLPVVSGHGVARLVVRDLLGRERVITQPYFATPRLLRGGLHEYSYEAGFVRESFGITSNDYGRFATVGTHRFGFTDSFTGEAHGELLRDQQAIGAGATYLWSGVGLFSASAAAGRGERGTGGFVGFGFERQAHRINFGANTQLATENFAQLGLQPAERAPAQTSSVFASYAAGRFGSFNLSYVHQGHRDREQTKLGSASYNLNLGKASVGVSLLHFLSGERQTIVGLSLSWPLDFRTSANASATLQRGSQQVLAQVQRSLPAGSGAGYRLLVGAGDSERQEAGVSAQTEHGTYILEAARSNGGEIGARATVSGAVAYLDGQMFLTRRITDSFAVVQISKGYSGVRVYADNQLVARTDAEGTALLPRLRAYQKNPVRIDVSDLPLDTDMDATQADAVPYFRSGLVLRFPIKRARDALLNIVLQDGQPLPAGAVAFLAGQKEEFPVGMNGELYLKGLTEQNQIRVRWKGQSCEFSVPFTQTKEPLPHLGTYSCTGVQP